MLATNSSALAEQLWPLFSAAVTSEALAQDEKAAGTPEALVQDSKSTVPEHVRVRVLPPWGGASAGVYAFPCHLQSMSHGESKSSDGQKLTENPIARTDEVGALTGVVPNRRLHSSTEGDESPMRSDVVRPGPGKN